MTTDHISIRIIDFKFFYSFSNFQNIQIFKPFNMAKCSNFSEIEGKVPLKRSFQLTGNENLVAVSQSPTYPWSHLSDVFLMKFDKEVHGT